MKEYGAVIERVTIERVTVKFKARSIEDASSRANGAAASGRFSGVTIVKPFEASGKIIRSRVVHVSEGR